MHLAVNIMMILLNWKYKTFKNWRNYHASLLYISACDFLYHCICVNYKLWIYRPSGFIASQQITNFLYSLFFLPATALLFLSYFPNEKTIQKKILYIMKWIVAFMAGEWLLLITGTMSHHNGWTMWWSLLFYLLMFPMLLLHHRRPLIAYPLTLVIIVFWVIMFDVPIK